MSSIVEINGNKLSNGNSFQIIKISNVLSIIVDSDDNIYSRYDSDNKIHWEYQLNPNEACTMSLYDIKQEYKEYKGLLV